MAAFVQGEGTAAAATSASQAFAGNVTAGNLIVVWGHQVSTTAGAFATDACTKSAGTAVIETLTQAASMAQSMGQGQACEAFWTARVTTGGSLTLQVARTAANPGTEVHVMEFSGNFGDAAARLEDSASAGSATDGQTAASTGDMTSAGAALFVGGVGTFGAALVAITEDGAWTLMDESTAGGAGTISAGTMYRIVEAGTTDAATWTLGSNNLGWVAGGIVLVEEAAAGLSIPVARHHYAMMQGR